MTTYENLTITDQDSVRTIALNRAAKKNAINVELARDLTDALRDAADDDAVKVLVVTGQKDFFCAGVDLTVFTGMAGGDGDLTLITKLNEPLQQFPKPLIAAVEGKAVGMGVTILPFFDMVYAGDDATFLTPFAKLGIVLEYGSSFTLPRLIGRQRANELILRAKPIDAATAEAWGLVTRVFPKDRLHEEVLAIATDVAANAPNATRMSRDLLRAGEESTLDTAIAAEWDMLMNKCYGSEEFLQSVQAFFMKGK